MKKTPSLSCSSRKKPQWVGATVRVYRSLKRSREGSKARHNDYLNLTINRKNLNNKGQYSYKNTKSLTSALKYSISLKKIPPALGIYKKYTPFSSGIILYLSCSTFRNILQFCSCFSTIYNIPQWAHSSLSSSRHKIRQGSMCTKD